MLHNLPKIVRRKKRVGRGIAGGGAKSGRGMKGQRSRAGYSSKAGFEGGQTPLYMRLPKARGAKQNFPSQVEKPQAISTRILNQFADGDIVGPGKLHKMGLIERREGKIKVIGNDPVTKKLTLRVHAATNGATEVIEKSGSKLEIIAS